MSAPQSSMVSPKSAGQLAYVLDDEPQIRAIVCQILGSLGWVSRQFSGPVQFFEELKSASPELIVLDLALGQFDAVEVIRKLEALRYKGKVLLISGRDEATLGEIQRIGQHRGLNMVSPLQKPFRAADLKQRLAEAQARTQAQTQAQIEPSEPAGAAPKKADPQPVRIDPSEALRHGWLRLWYQAKIDLKTMSVCGAEALLRARHPDHGIILPGAFLPPSGSAIYDPLTKFVLKQAIADWEHFAAQGCPLKLSINVPLSVLQSISFADLVRKSLPTKPSFPGLILEVTESDALLDPSGIREIAMQLKLYDVGISIDDFGEAHSSLARLRDLPCVELKLDRSFVSGCAKDAAKRSFCTAAIELAHGFGVTVCAEGVEDVEDLRTLVELGCHCAQGFLFAKPMDRVSFVNMMRGRSGESSNTYSPGRDATGVRLKMKA